jgi:methylmalonyl-CoA/ethylmalonyl-CoA epimerase
VSAADEISSLIRGLYNVDPAARERAGTAIFRLGCELANPATRKWLLDPEVGNYIDRDRAGIPALTIGLAVEPDNFEKIRAACESPHLAAVPPDQDAREFELAFPGGARLDVLTTTDPSGEGAIARFLRKSGEGIQQVEINVTDVDRVTEILRSRFGASPVDPATRAGADGTRVNFFLVPARQNRKVLIELVEDPRRNTREALQ